MAIPIFPAALPCNLLATNNGAAGQVFIKSKFDYDDRQRKTRCGKPLFGVSFNFTQAQYTEFLAFWDNEIYEGAREFNCNWSVFGIMSSNKVVIFTEPFTMQELGNGYFKVSGSCKLLERGA